MLFCIRYRDFCHQIINIDIALVRAQLPPWLKQRDEDAWDLADRCKGRFDLRISGATQDPFKTQPSLGRCLGMIRESFFRPVWGPSLDAFWLLVRGGQTQGLQNIVFRADARLWLWLVGTGNRKKMGSRKRSHPSMKMSALWRTMRWPAGC